MTNPIVSPAVSCTARTWTSNEGGATGMATRMPAAVRAIPAVA
jgi:hypothetical protein